MKKIAAFIFMVLTITTAAYSAGPTTHVFIAEQWMKANPVYTADQLGPFVVGNLFPDIRYLVKIKRDTTHRTGLSKDDILNAPNAFEAGINLHCYLDEQREALVVKWGIYNHLKVVEEGKRLDTLLKMIEDEILFDRIDLASTLVYINEIPSEELEKGISSDKIAEWHLVLTMFLSQRPRDVLHYLAVLHQPYLNIPASTVQLWHEHFDEFLANPAIQQYVEDLVSHFEKDFEGI